MKKSTIGWIACGVCAVAWMMFNSARSDQLDSLNPKIARLQQIDQEAKSLEQQANQVMQQSSALKAEVDDKTSWSSIASSGMRAVFDGFTFGTLADEGIFTESKRFDRWANDIAQRGAVRIEQARQVKAALDSLRQEYNTISQAASQEYKQYKFYNGARSWSVFIGIAALVFALIHVRQEQALASQPIQTEKHIVACDKCGQQMRVPKLDRNLRITCASCKNQFLLHS